MGRFCSCCHLLMCIQHKYLIIDYQNDIKWRQLVHSTLASSGGWC